MATFSEQLESALGGSDSPMSASAIEDILSGSGTTVQPGSVTPTSGSVNWNQIFENITTKTPLKAGQGLPEVPKGIPASTFYREATKAGKLPSGASQFFVKPLAPETKPFNLNTTTPTTPTITPTSSSSSDQNIVRQLRETAELEDIGGGEGNTQIDYDDPSKQYSSSNYSPAYSSADAAGALADENAFFTDTFGRIKDLGTDYNNEGFSTRNYRSPTQIDTLIDKAKGLVSDIPNPLDLASDKFDYFKENPFISGIGLLASAALPPIFGPFISPLIGAITSEGMGQIGMPGLNKNDYWGGGGPDGRGIETRSTVAGFADVPGYAMAVAVDAKGNVLSSPYGPTKGVVMYGFVTPAGTKAYQDKTYNRTSYDTPDQLEIDLDKAFEVTSPDIGEPEDYSYNNLSDITNTTANTAYGYDSTGGGSGYDAGASSYSDSQGGDGDGGETGGGDGSGGMGDQGGSGA